MKSLLLVVICSLCVISEVAGQKNKKPKRLYPRIATAAKCATKKGYFFCNHRDTSVGPYAESYEGVGFCCPSRGYKAYRRCVNFPSKGVECTLPNYYPTDQGIPLYMTYWVGLTPTQCNSTTH